MRLLDVFSLQIQSGFDDGLAGLSDEAEAQRKLWDLEPSEPSLSIPPYAILSHRWIGQEIVFQDFESVPKAQLRSLPPANPVPKTAVGAVSQDSTASVYKIAGACAKARGAGIRHLWIDTVCINKFDSRELSSAINSMFKWYSNAAICYVYLYDVTWDTAANTPDSDRDQQFRQSKWFTRGWTLQELLAPRQLEFFDRDWRYIGSKHDLVDSIVDATGISRDHLLGDFRTASTAQKMSWLSRRTTSIVEDRAYCMLGLFDVFLEPRYGQGTEEFMRLQREIFERFSSTGVVDESLFAWTSDLIETSGLLAPAPSCFRNSGHIVFERNLARTRKPRASDKPGMIIDAAYNVDFHVPRRTRYETAGIAAAHFLTLGTGSFGYMAAHSIYRRNKPSHLVNLNCWKRGPEQELQIVRIKVVQDKDKTWRRVECDKLFESNNPDFMHQSEVHGHEGRVFFPRQIKYSAQAK